MKREKLDILRILKGENRPYRLQLGFGEAGEIVIAGVIIGEEDRRAGG
jgi:hypothetical protein